MIPDHTGLLEENEAFVAGLNQIYGKTSIATFQDLVAMRSPAYFAGDLLKLKIVSMTEIMRRSILAGTEDSSFFSSLHTGLILSTKGGRRYDFIIMVSFLFWDMIHSLTILILHHLPLLLFKN